MKSNILIAIVASTLMAGVFADGCTVDTTAEKERCIGTLCSSSEQCISGYCMGLGEPFNIFKCGGCNDNDFASGFKCPDRYCNTTIECAVPQCDLTKPSPSGNWLGTCGGSILEYQGLKSWQVIAISVGSGVGVLFVALIVTFCCLIKKYKKRVADAEEKVRLLEAH